MEPAARWSEQLGGLGLVAAKRVAAATIVLPGTDTWRSGSVPERSQPLILAAEHVTCIDLVQ